MTAALVGGPDRGATALVRALVREVAGANRPSVRRPLVALRRARLAVGDPPIAWNLDGTELLLPLSHELPVHRAAHPDYSRNLGVVVAAVAAEHPGTTLVDIGANVGDSVAIVRAVADVPILCVEGDDHFLPYLRSNAAGVVDVEIDASYVATTVGLKAVERRGGTARLVEASDPGAEALAVRSLAEILADHPRFARPGIVKIDTDGHDATILRAASDLLAEVRPVLFFEHDPAMAAAVGADDPATIFGHLAALGYDRFLLYDNRGPLVGVRSAAEVADLERTSRALDPASAQPYLDVCALADEPAVLERLTSP